MHTARTLTFLVIVVLAASGSDTQAQAATIKVDSTTDEFGQPTPGGSDAGCSLREAVQAANIDSSFDGCKRRHAGRGRSDTVILQGGSAYLRSRGSLDDTNQGGDLDIAGPTRIEVEGKGRATLNALGFDRVIQILPTGSLDASNLVITRGVTGGTQGDTAGGGILVQVGKLDLRSSLITDNSIGTGTNCACGGGLVLTGGGSAELRHVNVYDNSSPARLGGGIVAAGGDLTLIDSTVAHNFSGESGGGGYLSGLKGDRIKIIRSTISDNSATRYGGGLIVRGSDPSSLPSISIKNSTISGNSANEGGGGLEVTGGHLKVNATTITENVADADHNNSGVGGGVDDSSTLYDYVGGTYRNSIVAGNSAVASVDCAGVPETFVDNLMGKEPTACPKAHSVLAKHPGLGSLADNGGSTETHAVRRRSPAVDAAGAKAPATDQRGRPRDARPDIGAYER
jgi:CSLREA domain-containing protein